MSTQDDGSRNTGNDTARIETFSDGVFAIAITLLVLEIQVPQVEDAPEGTSLLAALVGLWPSYLGYALSFLVIGTMWANHHNRFKLMVRSDHNLVLLNTLLLMCTAFIPFPTALLAGYIQGTEEQQTTAVASYSGTLAATAVVFTLLWLYAAHGYRLMDRNLDPTLLRAMTQRYVGGMVLYATAFALAFLNVVFSLALIAGLALLFVLPEPRSRPGKPEASAEDDGATEKSGT
jgi:uncharacterized membrane protein